jgi:hypothetical protein
LHRVRITTCGKSAFKYTTAVLWMILEKLTILTNLKTFYNHGMAMNVNAMLVNNFNII